MIKKFLELASGLLILVIMIMFIKSDVYAGTESTTSSTTITYELPAYGKTGAISIEFSSNVIGETGKFIGKIRVINDSVD